MSTDHVLTRREFVKRFRAAAIATGLVSSSGDAGSYARIPGANERVTHGLIGCGGRGQDVMRQFIQQGAVIGAVCDPDESRMRQAKKEAGDHSESNKDVRELLERQDIDAVIVATPDHWHALPTILACQA